MCMGELNNNIIITKKMSEQEETLQLDDEEMQSIRKKGQVKMKERISHWVLYCSRRGKKGNNEDYLKKLQEVGHFRSLSQFFYYYTGMKTPSELETDTKIQCFLHGCKPLWESWLHSGELIFNIKYKDEKKTPHNSLLLNETWQYLLLSMIGNTLPLSKLTQQHSMSIAEGCEDIIGISLCRREKATLIQVWFRTDNNALHLSRQIEADVLHHLEAVIPNYKPNSLQIRYKLHKDSLMNNSTIKGSFNLHNQLNNSF